MVSVKIGNWSFGFESGSANGRKRPLALVIMNGWGYSSRKDSNAIALANTPNYDHLCKNYPKTLLAASGSSVGLLQDTPGNSEVGHLSLGTGRVVCNERTRILDAIKSGDFFQNESVEKGV